MRTPGLRTPLLLFGVQDDDVMVARSVDAAIRHLRSHRLQRASPRGVEDFEVFDFDGRPVLLDQDLGGGYRVLDPWEYLDLRMRRLLRRHGGALPTEDTRQTGPGEEPESLGELPEAVVRALVDYLDGRTDLTTIVTVLADAAVRTHSGSALHNLCHRLHVCS
jgi:hypothetical protein